jgi:flagellar export protein FliJ
MKFKYPYENLMKTKKLGRDVAYRNFAEARGELEASQDTLQKYDDDIDSSRDLNQELASSRILMKDQLETMKWTQYFLEGQKVKIERQKVVIQKNQEVYEEKTMELSEAAKEFKIFEKLKERMKDKFKKAEKKRELKTVDEIVVMRAGRVDRRDRE